MSVKSALVYGSGVSGLIAAYYLNKGGYAVSVVDPYMEPKIKTLKTPEGLVERAANSILHNEAVRDLLEDIGLEYEMYSDLGKKKFVFLNSKAKRWPLSFMETLKSIGPLFSLAKKKEHMKPLLNETIGEWGLRTLGSAALENLMIPGLQGVYGGNTKELSANLVLKNIFSKDKKRALGSVSFKNGMQEFCDHLKKTLINRSVVFLKETEGEFDVTVVSSPAHSLPSCVNKETRELLSKVSYKKVSTVTIFVEEKDRMPFKGFGCVFKNQKEGVLGLILNSDIFDNRASKGLVSETWIFDGELVNTEEDALSRLSLFRKEKFLRENKIVKSHFKYWEKAFPAYDKKLEDALSKIDNEDSLYFFANWTGGLGIGTMIQAGEAFVEKIKKNEEGQNA
ncbi:MAG: protoporphyrinogen/coproporphyrinogen oxidase [Bdellovibrionales bacterium]